MAASTEISQPFVNHVIRTRSDPAARSALRRAANPATAHYAYAYLGVFLRGGPGDSAKLAFASLAASNHRVKHRKDRPLGRALKRTAGNKTESNDPIPRRLLTLQRQPLDRALTTFRGLFTLSEIHAVDWEDLYWIFSSWDHNDLAKRRSNRERVLVGFFTAPPKDDSTSQGTTTEEDAHE